MREVQRWVPDPGTGPAGRVFVLKAIKCQKSHGSWVHTLNFHVILGSIDNNLVCWDISVCLPWIMILNSFRQPARHVHAIRATINTPTPPHTHTITAYCEGSVVSVQPGFHHWSLKVMLSFDLFTFSLGDLSADGPTVFRLHSDIVSDRLPVQIWQGTGRIIVTSAGHL